MIAIPRLKRIVGYRFKTALSISADHNKILNFRGKDVPLTSAGSFAEKKKIVEKLWREFFADPLQWWDHRSEKLNPKFPDFKHRTTGQALWLIDNRNPPWVEVQLEALAPGTLKSSIFTWNNKLARFVKAREYEKAIDLFRQMQREGMTPDAFTFASILDACSGLGALEEGRNIHFQMIQTGQKFDVVLDTCLINMYAKCGSIEQARRVFDKMVTRDLVAWSAMILGYVQCKEGWQALRLYKRMQKHGFQPDSMCFVGLVNACACIGSLEEGRRVHEQILESDCQSDIYLDNSLVDMYAKCGSIEDAWKIFNSMDKRDVVSWNSIILGYAKSGEGTRALELYRQMQQEAVKPNPITFVGLLNACASLGALEEGRCLHQQIIQRGCESNFFVASSLVDMYAKCASIGDAKNIFDQMATRNVVAWSALILGYVKDGKGHEALKLYQQMRQERVKPNAATFVGILNACASLAALKDGRKVHKQIIESGYDSDVFVGSSLVDMYSKCGSIGEAQRVFESMPKHDVVTWSAVIIEDMPCMEVSMKP